jgi:phenylacetate-CoA oxygenase PaaJ subunit
MVMGTETTEGDVRAVLATVPDPEIPVLSVIDLGIIHRVAVHPERIDVAILPTFVGCPALDVIRGTIAERLEARFERDVRVETTFEAPWTSERRRGAPRFVRWASLPRPTRPTCAARSATAQTS